MRIDVLTLFPQIIEDYCNTSILGIARKKSLFSLYTHNPRNFATDKHKKVDNTCYGGGAGMLLMPEPFCACLDSVLLELDNIEETEIILTAPSGKPWTQVLAKEFSQKKNLIFLCGRYEGFDQRIKNRASIEISLGDFVLTGGELAALAIIDSTLRLRSGILGDDQSSEFESFSLLNLQDQFKHLQVTKRELTEFLSRTGFASLTDIEKLRLLEYPQYTTPSDFQGSKVPEILQSGDHKKIFLWRLEQAIALTKEKRPDLLNPLN